MTYTTKVQRIERLIAAAPDMLAALDRCLRELSKHRPKKFNFDYELAMAEAGLAIAKAEGRQ